MNDYEKFKNGVYIWYKLLPDTQVKLLEYCIYELGIPNPLKMGQFHVTLISTNNFFKWNTNDQHMAVVSPKSYEFHIFKTQTGENSLVLKFKNDYLDRRYQMCINSGATPRHAEFISHVTLSYNIGVWDFYKERCLPKFPLLLRGEVVEPFSLNALDKF